jgi:CRISPR-associated protein Csb2
MLVIDVELLDGTIRASGTDDLAGTGWSTNGEWPPSPARLLSALVAADGTGSRCRVSTGRGLALLESSPPPTIVCSGPEEITHNVIVPRFVVRDERLKSTMHDYPARKGEEVRPGVRMCPRSPLLSYVWPEVEPDQDEIADLEVRAARVPYFGCADSPARVCVRTAGVVGEDAWEPLTPAEQRHSRRDVVLPVPYEGFVADLDAQYAQFSAGAFVRRAWITGDTRTYRHTSTVMAPSAPSPTTSLWYRMANGAVSGRHVLPLAEALRSTAMSRYDDVVRNGDGRLPPVLTGHGFSPGEKHDQVLFIALPDAGYRYSDGRIHGMAIVVPVQEQALHRDLRRALGTALALNLPGGRHVELASYGGEGERPAKGPGGARPPFAAAPRRWEQAARRFVSVTPVVQERFRRGGPTLADVGRWCEHAGLPAPVDARWSRHPLTGGAADLRPGEVHRNGRPQRPYLHVELRFDVDVQGPVVIGSGRSWGLGLLAPVTTAAMVGRGEADDA